MSFSCKHCHRSFTSAHGMRVHCGISRGCNEKKMSETPASPFVDPSCSFTSPSRESANPGPRKLWVLSGKKKKISKKEIPCRQPSSGEEEEGTCNEGDDGESEDESEAEEEDEDIPLAQLADEYQTRQKTAK